MPIRQSTKPLASQRGGRIRIQDVARVARVSLSTVSGVLNEKDNISPETRLRVLGVIAQLGYTPNLFASNLARRKTKLVGIIVSDLLNPFFAEIAKALDEQARERGFETFLTSTDFVAEKQAAAVRQMLALRVAGIAMMTSENNPEAFFLLKASGTPAVYLDNSHTASTISTVRVDKRHGMFVAVQHLLELGHRRILLIRNSLPGQAGAPMFSHQERMQGFEDAVHQFGERGMDIHILDEEGDPAAAGRRGVQRALGRHRFTAVVAINDLVALGVYRGLQMAGLSVPLDVSVVGFDNIYLCEYLQPPLTTVATPRVELARNVLRMLYGYIDGTTVENDGVLNAEIIVRESTAPPRDELTLPQGL